MQEQALGQQLSADGRRVVDELSQRHGVSPEAVTTLLHALVNSNGSMAQFSHPDLGGMGQWSRGGMVMVGDMFNDALKQRVNALCTDLSQEIGRHQLLQEPAHRSAQASGSSSSSNIGSGSSGAWWPDNLGRPSSTGAQNNMRYACFPDTRRLAIDVGGHVTVYDTADHQITGFGQQQSGDASLSLTSQRGVVRVADLAIVSPVQVAASASPKGQTFRPTPVDEAGNAVKREPANHDLSAAASAGLPSHPSHEQIIAAIERLAELKDKGILSEQEFAAKKAELLSRL